MSTGIDNDFVVDNSFRTPPVTFTASGRFRDLKNSVIFSTDIQLPSSLYKVHTYEVKVDLLTGSTNDKQKPFDLVGLDAVESDPNTNTSTVYAMTISPQYGGSNVLTYPFENNTEYKILYEIYIINKQNHALRYKLTHTQYFKYHAEPVTISDFTFNDNVQKYDSIFVSGVSLLPHGSSDTTIPEHTRNSDDTIDYSAIEFSFQEVDVGNSNNEPTEPYIVELSYNPLGTYTLPNNTLTTGKLYTVMLTARWKLGYSTSQVASQTLYILNRPVISNASGVTILPLDVKDPSDNVIEIRVNDLANSDGHAQPSKIWFEFYNNANTLVAITGGNSDPNASGNPTSDGTVISGNLYPFRLDEIHRVNDGDGIVNGVTYKIKAVVKYDDDKYDAYPNTPQWRRSDEYTNVVFDLVKPVISSITPYDVQNDDGNDGVYSGSSDVDGSGNIVATVSVNNAEYELYAPSNIKFNIYNSTGSNKLADTPLRPFTNNILALPGTQTYNILLSEINLIGGASTLTNGTLYKVKAEVTLDGEPDSRESDSFTSITFSQNIAPVISLTIANTWELATTDDPSSSQSRFLDSPEFGVSGHFKKTAQFGLQTGNTYYSKHLDTTNTKFKLEYQLNTDASTTWRTVTRAILIQRESDQPLEDAVIAAKQSTIYNSSGVYDNVVPTSPALGTSQPEMVFYIPQIQASEGDVKAFDEPNQIKVKVTIIDNAELWKPVPDSTAPTFIYSNESEKVSNNLFVIRRIESYNYTVGASSEPWNSQYKAHYDISTNLLHVDVNGTIITTNNSNVKADSNSIIQELDEGWKIVNTGVGTSGAAVGSLPKVNLYFYGNSVAAGSQNSSNSFTVSEISDMGAVIDQHAGAKEYPFFIVYTTPTGSSDKVPGFYKSKLFYAPQSSGDTTIDSSKVGLTLLYTGDDNSSSYPEIPTHRRIRYELLPHDGVLTNANSGYANERVNSVSLHTSSNASTSQAGNFNFTLQEAGLMTDSSVLSLLVMRFTKKLALNIPVNWKSTYAHSVSVSYRYTTEEYNTMTFNHEPTLTNPQHVTIYLDPTLGTTVDYEIFYFIKNKNRAANGTVTTKGVFHPHPSPAAAAPAKPDTSPAVFNNQFFPESSDYIVTNSTYKTFNNGDLQNGESSITFDLSFDVDTKNRMDGVNVYFTSPSVGTGSNANNGSGIAKVRIKSYTTTSPGQTTITLLQSTGGKLRIMDDASGAIVDSDESWGDYDMANITFEAYRDARVDSIDASYNPVSDASVPVTSNFYVESGSQSTFGTSSNSNPIWNVPVLTRPSVDASGENKYELSGGVINIDSASDHYITWPTATDANGEPFTYDIKVTSDVSGVIVGASGVDLTGSSYVLPIDLDTVDRYVIEIRKVFNGSITQRERSAADVIVFHSVEVDTSNMAVSVVNPSNTSSVTLSWGQAVITGYSVDVSNNIVIDEPASFANNIYAHHIKYRIGSSGDYSRLGSGNIIENSSPTLYTLPNTALGTLYNFVMYVEAQVKYTLNTDVSSTKSSPFAVPITPVTALSKYIVSTIPSIILPHDSPVLMQNSSNPTLLLNLNANGLEDEGFISVVVILTQDGTPAKPEGEQVLLVFPDSSNNVFPFNFPNTVDGSSGMGPNDPRLAGGDSATSAPRNLTSSVLSTDPSNNTYTLTIGTAGDNGRYGLSPLRMPLTEHSNFVDSLPVNYMVILTTRRGTDIGVGQFTYQAIPSVNNVTITTTNGQYYVNFNLTPS